MTARFKLRAWDERADEIAKAGGALIGGGTSGMIYYDGPKIYDMSIDYPTRRHIECEPEELVFMQCTGLKDKNGRLIYEGDIISIHQFLFDGTEYENEIIGEIVYFTESMCFAVRNINHKDICEYMGYENVEDAKDEIIPLNCFYGLHEESFAVVGNIYENLELLD